MVMAMAMMAETTKAIRFPPSTTPAANFCSSLPRSSSVIHWNKFGRLNGVSFVRRSSHLKSKIQASAENLDSNLDSSKQNGKLEYHPSEGIGESTSETSSDAMLTPQETCRTIVEEEMQVYEHLHRIPTYNPNPDILKSKLPLPYTDISKLGSLTLKKTVSKQKKEMVMAMAMMAETTKAIRFPPSTTPAANFCSSLPRSSSVIHWNKFGRLNGVSFVRRSSHLKSKIQASAENLDSNLDSSKQNGKLEYHPSEGIGESTSETSSDAMLTPQETCRTIVEAKSKATLMLTGVINDDIHENIIWPDLPYVTDEHGNIYFQVKNDEDILQTLTTENNFVQAIIGFDATEMLSEMEALGTSEIDFGIEEIEEEDSDVQDGANEDDDDYDEDLVAVLDDDEEDDSDEDLGDWAKLETMSSSHPMYFAKKLAEVASDDPIDWMEQPPAGLAIQGLIRPAFMEEQSDIQRHMSVNQSRHAGTNQVGQSIEGKLEEPGVINGHEQNYESSEDISMWREESEKDEATSSGTSFYKLEMIKIQLISAHGHQTKVEVEDFRKAQPDAIALSAAKIISRLKAGGEKIMQAFKSLCWRCKGIQVEEAAIIDVDSLGFGLRVCSGTQIQTLRFAFNSRATSEYSAERQLNDLLFPRIQSRLQKKNIAKMP